MNTQEVAALVVDRLTGHGEICLDIEATTVEKLVHDAFTEACPWFDEPAYFKTLSVVSVAPPRGSDGTGGYVDTSQMDPQVKYIRNVFTVQSRYYHTGDIVRDLLLLPAAPLETESIQEHAAWQMAWPMVKDMLGRLLSYKWDEQSKKVWIDDAQEGAVTLDYVPEITDVSQVTHKKALNWIINMTEARAMLTISRVRGKFRGALTLETDASDMGSDANTKIERLQEDLRTLHFVSVPR